MYIITRYRRRFGPTLADGYACGARMSWLESGYGGTMDPLEACASVAEAYPEECGVCNPQPGATAAAASKTEVVSVTNWGPAAYQLSVNANRRLCNGYGMPSSPALPGGNYAVDCVGNCMTGERRGPRTHLRP